MTRSWGRLKLIYKSSKHNKRGVLFNYKKLKSENDALKQELATLKAHGECRLGQWYTKADGNGFQNLISYPMIEEPHRLVHEYGRKAMQSGLNKNADDIINSVHAMEEASTRVVYQLDVLMEEIINAK
ncbi:CZB domain-containing protein [Vibrio sp. TH_r3]|uniref:CZB domain-containing protein n=1 Tax=Vibrio sp. TH_r3 TaxID=3082084 RepID=UPI002953F6D0|nr:CZB domain-containing protein [Vibrio sp. TH_r3]MDV7104654.1 CZB domain-containing protein [Vibrio sp. TH_r3]